LLHWLEDSYGQPHWPITGKWITAPNILHHQAPSAFTENSWLRSADVLLVIGAVIIGVAWLVGMLTWQFLLFVAIGVNANEIHKWNHLPRKKRGKLVVALQDARLLQSAKHHGKHHVGSKDTHYCVVTNVLNPVLDGVRAYEYHQYEVVEGIEHRARGPRVPRRQDFDHGKTDRGAAVLLDERHQSGTLMPRTGDEHAQTGQRAVRAASADISHRPQPLA
jgi:ubiquitin-conjugating enzyme E2 variant